MELIRTWILSVTVSAMVIAVAVALIQFAQLPVLREICRFYIWVIVSTDCAGLVRYNKGITLQKKGNCHEHGCIRFGDSR